MTSRKRRSASARVHVRYGRTVFRGGAPPCRYRKSCSNGATIESSNGAMIDHSARGTEARSKVKPAGIRIRCSPSTYVYGLTRIHRSRAGASMTYVITGGASSDPGTRTAWSTTRIDAFRSIRGSASGVSWSILSSPADFGGKGARAVDVHDARARLRVSVVLGDADPVDAVLHRRPHDAETLVVAQDLEVDGSAWHLHVRAGTGTAHGLVSLRRPVVRGQPERHARIQAHHVEEQQEARIHLPRVAELGRQEAAHAVPWRDHVPHRMSLVGKLRGDSRERSVFLHGFGSSLKIRTTIWMTGRSPLAHFTFWTMLADSCRISAQSTTVVAGSPSVNSAT